MNEITLLREAGPEAPALTPAARNQARAALLAEIDAVGHGWGRRLRRPSRRTALRIGLAAATAAAAWTAAVVISAPDQVGPPPGSVTLVAFEPPAFPLSLEPAPAGLTPSFSADPGGVLHAGYSGADDRDHIFMTVTPEEPEQYGVDDVEDVSVDGRDAELVHGTDQVCGGPGPECIDVEEPYVHLVWERRDGQWVQIGGAGRYDDPDRLLAIAESLVDRPQPVPLQVHLAPAGWSVQAYKDNRILTLVNDSYEQQTLNVYLPLPENVVPADELRSQLMGPVGPIIEVTVNDRPAQLVRTDNGPMDNGWFLQAQFPDGTTFVVQAPGAFTQDQVLEFAAQVTYSPPA
jgi:hypothetical protein